MTRRLAIIVAVIAALAAAAFLGYAAFVKRPVEIRAARIEQNVPVEQAGDLRDTLDCNDAAFLLIGLIHGLAVRWSPSGCAFGLVGEGRRLLDVQLTGSSHLTSAAVADRMSA